MEPRLATLLGESLMDRTNLDPLLFLPPLVASRRPHPAEPDPTARSQASPPRTKKSAPIAGVLNDVSQRSDQGSSAVAQAASLPPFSGRLSDLLLDPSQQHVHKRRRVDESEVPQTTSASHENSRMMLPQPTQQPKKAPKRPRIPPLLQGLHQPPPVPSSAFPPITGERGGFQRSREEIISADRPSVHHALHGPRRASACEHLNAIAVRKDPANASKSPASGSKAAGADSDGRVPAQNNKDRVLHVQATASRKRNKWSAQETKDLLIGVSRYGIGSWKKILNCPDFAFNQRSAVDLKDRFRVCRPGDGLKAKKVKGSSEVSRDPESQQSTTSVSFTMSSVHDGATNESPPSSLTGMPMQRKGCAESHQKDAAELAEMGIHTPFVKVQRRERHDFSALDDQNLMKGFEKHGASWRSIRNDQVFKFSNRHPTDLRDRFRIRFPEQFAKAGYKLKAKEEKALKMDAEERATDDSTEPHIDAIYKAPSDVTSFDTSFASASTLSPNRQALPAVSIRRAANDTFAPLADTVHGFVADDLEATGHSPITLSRNIFDWADANPTPTTSATGHNSANASALLLDLPPSLLQMTETVSFDPALDVLASTTSVTNTTVPAVGTLQPSPFRLTQLVSTATDHVSSTQASEIRASRYANRLLRTSNLPTIVFPHVPVASARGAPHKLPRPADLLMGFDGDGRPDAQSLGFILQE